MHKNTKGILNNEQKRLKISQYFIGFPYNFFVYSKSILHCISFHCLFIKGIQMRASYDAEAEEK